MLIWVAVFIMLLGFIIIMHALFKNGLLERKQADEVVLTDVSKNTPTQVSATPSISDEGTKDAMMDEINTNEEVSSYVKDLNESNDVHTPTDFNQEDVMHQQSTMESENYQDTLSVYVYPKDASQMIEGASIIELMKSYSMFYNPALRWFCRYSNQTGQGELWFSMLGVYANNYQNFDLNDLSKQKYHGLVFFVRLPHPQPVRAFDAMMQMVFMMADELSAYVYHKDQDAEQLALVDDAWISAKSANL